MQRVRDFLHKLFFSSRDNHTRHGTTEEMLLYVQQVPLFLGMMFLIARYEFDEHKCKIFPTRRRLTEGRNILLRAHAALECSRGLLTAVNGSDVASRCQVAVLVYEL